MSLKHWHVVRTDVILVHNSTSDGRVKKDPICKRTVNAEMTNVHSTKTRIVRGGSRWGWWLPCSNPGLPAAHHTMILLQYGIINASNTWRHALQLATPKTPSQQILKPPLQTVIHELNRNCYHRFPWSNKMQNFHWHVKCSLAAWSTSMHGLQCNSQNWKYFISFTYQKESKKQKNVKTLSVVNYFFSSIFVRLPISS